MNNPINPIDESSKISLKRINTLTDCVFALCLILLVIFIEKPPASMPSTESAIRNYLFGQKDMMIAYLITFINIAFYWVFSHNASKQLRRSDGVHVWLTMLALLFVGLLPFANGLNEAFSSSFTIHIFYSGIVFMVGLFFGADWIYAAWGDRLVNRSISEGSVEGLIVESIIQPSAAILSIAGAFVSDFAWELPFMLVPFAGIIISKIWNRRRKKILI